MKTSEPLKIPLGMSGISDGFDPGGCNENKRTMYNPVRDVRY